MCAQVNKYIAEKDEMMEKLAFAERQLEEEGKAHARAIADLERKHVQEKDRLKKEMLHKLRETKANLLKLTDNQLDTTTKRTIAENEQMSSELAWQSKETEKLIKKNNQLVAEIGSLKLELSLNRQTESEMAKKVNAYQKTIQALMNKLSSMGAEQEAELLRRTALTEDADRERTESLNERAHLSQELEQAQALLAASQEEVARLREQLRDMEAKHANVLLLQDDAVKFTLQCLEDMRTKHLATSLSKLPTREASALASESMRKRTLLALPSRLKSFPPLSCPVFLSCRAQRACCVHTNVCTSGCMASHHCLLASSVVSSAAHHPSNAMPLFMGTAWAPPAVASPCYPCAWPLRART